MGKYVIKWFKKDRYKEPIVRSTFVDSQTMSGAMHAFCRAMGSLTKNTVMYIQEVNTDGSLSGDKYAVAKNAYNDFDFSKLEGAVSA